MTAEHPEIGGRYAKYVLLVLVIVYVFNFVDRQVLSILAEEIKAELGISDAEMGFLYGTYIIGQVSDALTSTGLDSGEALRRAMLAAIPIYLITAISLVVASRYLAGDEASRLERARAAGEPV